MDDVTVGAGSLAGRGVYAGRDFDAGEVVVRYELQPLTIEEYEALPAGEEIFVHSYGGRRYLYPAPARFVNHSDDPSCFQDFDQGCDVALRPIRAGQQITIDARQETARELDTFMITFVDVLGHRCRQGLTGLLDKAVNLWWDGCRASGQDAVIDRLLSAQVLPLGEIEWLIGTGRWEALCSARAGAAGTHLSMLLKILSGNWQVVYLHLG